MASNEKYQDFLIDHLANHDEAVAYLNAALEESLKEDEPTQQLFLIALWNVAEARGGIEFIAKKAHISPESFNKMLSGNGNLEWRTIVYMCAAMGLNLRLI